MALIVQKFGGTSVGDLDRIRHVADKIIATRAQGHQVVVVASAMAGETNRLLGLGQALSDNPSPREMDALAATGEQVSNALLAIALNDKGSPALSLQGWQLPVHTDDVFMKARIEHIETDRIRAELAAGKVVLVTGFQGVTPTGDITTLGRGGGDTSAVALAAAINADECQIFTDVDGVYTTDPRMVPEAHRLDSITFKEMLELASQGSKVLQTRSVEFAGKFRVPLRVLSTFKDGPGTLITFEQAAEHTTAAAPGRSAGMEAPLVSGIAFSRQEAQLTITNVPDEPGTAARLFGVLAAAHIESDMITQTPRADRRTDFSFTVARNEAGAARDLLLNRCSFLTGDAITLSSHVAKVSVVGVAMRTHPELATRLFEALAAERINLMAITSSESKVSVLIEERYLELAVRTLHTAFGLDQGAVGA
ncbi:aspartate kinase [Permianibacter sp. IMCC34836]|uniref:aspartate kinase n=1 Tax=Permianibacter fluminis TaxID=2738515 RepID=UPI0015518E6E|nr:aspartate kinase [Permianibacter fluminis]NQD38197.1 aspartate kinase [Permianibacter fluminis]